jgi:ABC-type lipoprotein release transport system permease subunit
MRIWGGRGRLRHGRLQTVLAIAAIATAVALPVVLISVGGGVSAHELSDLENAGYQIVISASGLHGIAHAHPLADRLLALASVTAASPVLSVPIDAFLGSGGAIPALAEGIIPDQFSPTLGPTESGLFPSPLPLGDPTDSVHFDNGSYGGSASYDVLVSSPFAQAYHLSGGSLLTLAPVANESQGTAYHVSGIFGVPLGSLGETGAFAILIPLSDLQVLTGFSNASGVPVPDAADTVEVAVGGSVATDPGALDQVRNEIQAMVPYYSVSSLDQQAQQLQSASAVLTGFYLALSSVGLTVGLVFLALVMLRRVETDRRSIGIRRAIGVPGRTLVGGVLLEGLTLAILGSVGGLVGGYVLVAALATWGTGAVQEAASLAEFVPLTLLELVLGISGLSLLAGGLAARAALRVDIAEALR